LFDVNVVGNDFPGEGPAGTSGSDCNHNFITEAWTTNNEIPVDTTSPVPTCYLTDARYPDGIPGHTENVISVIGSTKVSVFFENHAPRTLTFLVVATDSKVETVGMTLNYDDLDLDQATFYIPCGPRLPSCEVAPCGVRGDPRTARITCGTLSRNKTASSWPPSILPWCPPPGNV